MDEDLLTVYREDGNSLEVLNRKTGECQGILWIIPNLWKMLQN